MAGLEKKQVQLLRRRGRRLSVSCDRRTWQRAEAGLAFHFRPAGLYQADWTSPVTSRFLLEAGASLSMTHWPTYLNPGVKPTDISVLELSNNYRYNASATYASKRATDRAAQRLSVSYVTGTHAFKVGMQIEEAVSDIAT